MVMVAIRNGWRARFTRATAMVSLAAIAGFMLPAHGAGNPAAPKDHLLLQANIPLSAGGATIAPKYQYLFAQNARWKGPLRWKYNHANAPAALATDKGAVIAQLQKSFDKWTSQCGISYLYEGETAVPPNTLNPDPVNGAQPDGASVVGWGALDPTLGGWTYAWYAQSGNDRVIFDADVTLSTTNVTSMSELDRLMTHEWGHALGLDHSNTESAIMAGPPSTHYNALVSLQDDDMRGCRCAYGLPPGVNAAYACSLPTQVNFGSAAVGTASPAQVVTLTNNGNAPLSIQSSTVSDAQFRHVAGCTAGTVVMPGASCSLQVEARPAALGAVAAKLALFTNDGFYELPLAANGVPESNAAGSAGATVEVIEYYNAALDHFFITWIAAEIANLDAGATPTKWTRTGLGFRAHETPQPGTSQVCRFYIPPADGNSHFFGRSAGECNASLANNPEFILEDPDYMRLAVPAAGVCPAGTRPIYRLFNNRADTNHRYTTERAVRDEMVAKGWIAEGDGPDLVAMCAPV